MSQRNFLVRTRTECDGVAACPSGKRAVAGGGILNHADMYMTRSQPYEPSGSSNWLVRWESEDNTGRDPNYAETWALCIPGTLPD